MKRAIRIAVCLISATIVMHASIWAQTSNPRDLGCKQCHECDLPTKSNPCLKACPRGQMITVHHSAEAGPAIVTLDKVTGSPDVYEPVKFDHREHAKMSEMSGGCVQCHHYNLSGNVLACRTCHDVNTASKDADLSKPGLKGAYHRRCVNCHRESGLDTKCDGSCHHAKSAAGARTTEVSVTKPVSRISRPDRFVFQSSTEDVKPVSFSHSDHTDRFGLVCSSCHADERCSKCHKPEGTAATPAAHLEGGHDRCSACHSVTDNCAKCHGNKPGQRFDHARKTGFDLNRFHSSLACAKCHKQKSEFKGLSPKCNGCHAEWKPGSFDHTVTGVKLDDNHSALDCVSCHVESDFAKKPSCKDCHDDKSYPGAVPGTQVKISRKNGR